MESHFSWSSSFEFALKEVPRFREFINFHKPGIFVEICVPKMFVASFVLVLGQGSSRWYSSQEAILSDYVSSTLHYITLYQKAKPSVFFIPCFSPKKIHLLFIALFPFQQPQRGVPAVSGATQPHSAWMDERRG